MSLELVARTDPGARLVALAETLADEIGPRAAGHDRAGSFPFDSFAAVKRERVLHGADTGAARRARCHLRARPARRLEPARPRRRRADPGREHAPRLRAQRRPALADRDGGGRRAARRALRRDARGDRARPAPSSLPAGSEPRQDLTRPATTARRTDDGWSSPATRFLHHVARRRRPVHRRHLHRRRRPRAVRLRDDPAHTPPAWSSTTTGTRSACAPPAATRSPSRTCGCRRRRCAAASPWRARSIHGAEPLCRALPRGRRPRDRGERARDAAGGSRGRDRLTRTRDARRGELRRPLRRPRGVLARRGADRRAPRAQPELTGDEEELTRLFAEAQAAKLSSVTRHLALSTTRWRCPAAPAT